MNRAQGIASLALIVVAVAAGLWWGRVDTQVPLSPATWPTDAGLPTSTSESLITVHVAGHVRRPGLVAISEGSRVADAIAAAGGLMPGARAESVNLAAPVADGERVVVSGPGEASETNISEGSEGKLHLNAATAAELDALPGVGPVIAQRIVTFRDENGPFGSVDDLLDVPGIGEAKLADLRDRVQVP
jgi:competence protein ComEA